MTDSFYRRLLSGVNLFSEVKKEIDHSIEANYPIQCMYSKNEVRKVNLLYGTEEELRTALLETDNSYYLTEEAVQIIIERFPAFFDNKKINILSIDDFNRLYCTWEILL